MFLDYFNSDIGFILLEKIDRITYINLRLTSIYINKFLYKTTKFLPLILETYFRLPFLKDEKYQICSCSETKISYEKKDIKKYDCIFKNYIHELRYIKFFLNIPKKIECQLINKNLEYPKNFINKFNIVEKKIYYLWKSDSFYLVTESMDIKQSKFFLIN